MSLVVEVVCDAAEADAGFVGDRLMSHHGARLFFTSRDELIAGRESAGDLLLLLGSERSVCDPGQVAVVETESDLVTRSLASGIPVLGICYGAQVLAHALGGEVFAAERVEVGWFDVESVDENLCPAVEWTQFHEDGFTPGRRNDPWGVIERVPGVQPRSDGQSSARLAIPPGGQCSALCQVG